MDERGGRSRRRLGHWGLVAVLAALAGLSVPTATAPSAWSAGTNPGPVSIDVEAGYGRLYRPGRPVPVRVTLRGERLVRGTLEVAILAPFGDGRMSRTIVPIEIPGGSTKVLTVVLTTALGLGELDVRADLRAGSATTTGRARLEPGRDVELVGLLPGVVAAELPSPEPLPADAGTARFVVLDADLLAAGPGVLGPMGTVVAGPADLAQLSPSTHAGLLAWVLQGGRLVVDSAPDPAFAGLPSSWSAGSAERRPIGLGELVWSDGAAAAGRWSDVVEPTAAALEGELVGFGFGFANEDLGSSVARDAGVQSTSLGGILAVLGLYAVLVGPGAMLVLRRGRSVLAWVVVPALALVFTVAVVAVGTELRRGARPSHGTVLQADDDGGAYATTFLGLVSRSGRDARVELPEGWTAAAPNTYFGGGGGPSMAVVAGGARDELQVQLDPGQFGLVGVAGPTTTTGSLVVAGTATGSNASGTVRNTTDLALEEVAILVDNRAVNIGTLSAGEERTWDLADAQPGPFQGWFGPGGTPVEVLAWPRSVGLDGQPDFTGPVSLSLLQQAVGAAGDYHPAGTAIAVGWTRQYSPPSHGGGASPEGRTAVMGRGRVQPTGVRLSGLGVPRTHLRVSQLGGNQGAPSLRVTTRYVVPAGWVDATDLEVLVPAATQAVQVWRNGRWDDLALRDVAAGDADAADTTSGAPGPLPPPAVAPATTIALGGEIADGTARAATLQGGIAPDGVLYVRTTIRQDLGPAYGPYQVRSRP